MRPSSHPEKREGNTLVPHSHTSYEQRRDDRRRGVVRDGDEGIVAAVSEAVLLADDDEEAALLATAIASSVKTAASAAAPGATVVADDDDPIFAPLFACTVTTDDVCLGVGSTCMCHPRYSIIRWKVRERIYSIIIVLVCVCVTFFEHFVI